MKNVLFINLGGLGDEIMFLPSIISFKRQYPSARVTLALEKRSAGILELTDVIDELVFVDKTKMGMLKLLISMWRGRFDAVISSGSNQLISVLLALSGIRLRVGYNSGSLSQKLLTHPVSLNKKQYAVDMYHSLVTPLTDYRTLLPEFDVEQEIVREGTILIHPGVSRKSIEAGMVKTITAEAWAELIMILAKSGQKILLTGGKDDVETLDKIKSKLSPNDYLEVKTESLKDLARLISSAEKFVCSDSAPLHIAVGMGTRTFVFFGSTDYTKLIPQNELITPILNDFECPLRPCLWENRQTSCAELGCLKFDIEKVAKLILG